VMRRIEKRLAGTSDIAHYATFVGQSAPRFYYNLDSAKANKIVV